MIPTTLALGINTGVGVNLLFLPPQCLLLSPSLCLLRFLAGPRNREPASPSICSTPTPTLRDARHFVDDAAAAASFCSDIAGRFDLLLHACLRRRPSSGEFFFLCSSSFLLLYSFILVTILA
jgi:hypothetical protein